MQFIDQCIGDTSLCHLNVSPVCDPIEVLKKLCDIFFIVGIFHGLGFKMVVLAGLKWGNTNSVSLASVFQVKPTCSEFQMWDCPPP